MPNQVAKISCLINYFKRITQKPPKGKVTFSRHVMDPSQINWENRSDLFRKLTVNTTNEGIESLKNACHVDFANKYIGGGVLRWGCVQEEIMFMTSPECLVGLLFLPKMEDNESISIKGAERYSKHKGYGKFFQFVDEVVDDNNSLDETGHVNTFKIVIDAFSYLSTEAQFHPDNIMRELNKAYCGFFNTPDLSIGTGNWGCGVFNGHHQLKAVIQLVVAATVGREVVYFPFGESSVSEPLSKFHEFLVDNKITTGEVVRELLSMGWTNDVFSCLRAKLDGRMQPTVIHF
eukprot:TRINITY_DN269_c0_g1_i1.p1 TRINITY_DN269_c0_g1~~TRINITY_DN269_c0_g1_i1.p1  ORF type:complete len:290 (+),score=51.72 TRINITY_DN269_c0_g1_i1:660-1529(+)